MYGAPTDPTPYITAAYAIGFIGIFGFTIWLFWQRHQLRVMLKAIKEDKTHGI
jgi:hypothetical protein